jgi:hypothetical protein
MGFSIKNSNVLILLSSSSLLYYFYQNKVNNLFSIFSYENQSANLDKDKDKDIFINLNTANYFSDSIEESNTYLNNIDKLKNLDKSQHNNVLINKINKIMNNANGDMNKTDFIMIKSIELLLNQNIYNKINTKELDNTIELFINNNKLKCLDKASYNNILTGEILNYLASI